MTHIILIGLSAVVACTIVQCAMIAFLRRGVQYWRRTQGPAHNFLQETLFLSSIVAALFLGICVQVWIWAALFLYNGDLPDVSTALYYSMASFTTVGYGDVVLKGPNELLGPMEACNGILMGGLATGFLFSTMQSRYESWTPRTHRATSHGE